MSWDASLHCEGSLIIAEDDEDLQVQSYGRKDYIMSCLHYVTMLFSLQSVLSTKRQKCGGNAGVFQGANQEKSSCTVLVQVFYEGHSPREDLILKGVLYVLHFKVITKAVWWHTICHAF
jgi:hypothetical protein